jgi:RimJ/RimL family protein N-acetyltransferase
LELRTERLLLRRFRDEDRVPFAAINADPRVMEHFVAPLDRAASDAFVDRIEERRDERGYSLWAIEVVDRPAPLAERFIGVAPSAGRFIGVAPSAGRFIGYVGLWDATFEAHFTPTVEVGWRLAAEAWGNGYATEAAEASVDDGFVRVGLPEILSFTATVNRRSRAVMERIGLVRDPVGDFDHPSSPAGHPTRRHVLYRFPDLEERRRRAWSRPARSDQTSVTSGGEVSSSSAPPTAHPSSSTSR